MTIHYLRKDYTMHTQEWPARRCSACSKCNTPAACDQPEDDEPANQREAVAAGAAVMGWGVIGLLLILAGVWAWGML